MFKLWWIWIVMFTAGCGILPVEESSVTERIPSVPPTAAVVLPTPTVTRMEAAAAPKLEPSGTPSGLAPARANSPTAEPAAKFPYDIQLGSPRSLPDLRAAERGCQWLGVAGQVFDAAGEPVEGLVVVVRGDLQGKAVDGLGLTGLARDYGPGGFEIELANQPAASSGTLTAQLFNDRWEPLSQAYAFETSADCANNLVLVNFQGAGAIQRVFLPAVESGAMP